MPESEFNPSEHTVDDVHAHLKENPEDAQRVLEAEKAGKNRSTLVSGLEEQLASVPVAAEPKAVVVEPASAPGLLDQFEVTAERGYRKKA